MKFTMLNEYVATDSYTHIRMTPMQVSRPARYQVPRIPISPMVNATGNPRNSRINIKPSVRIPTVMGCNWMVMALKSNSIPFEELCGVQTHIPQTVMLLPSYSSSRTKIFFSQGRFGVRSKITRFPSDAPHRSI